MNITNKHHNKTGKMEKQIQTALVTTYPYTPKTQQQKDQDWINKQKTWRSESERRTMEYLIWGGRRNLQKRLEQLTKNQNTNAENLTQKNNLHMETKHAKTKKRQPGTKPHANSAPSRTRTHLGTTYMMDRKTT